jgi:hypothetical protein
VRQLHVGLHGSTAGLGDRSGDLLRAVDGDAWRLVELFPPLPAGASVLDPAAATPTRFGPVVFADGMLSLSNPALGGGGADRFSDSWTEP